MGLQQELGMPNPISDTAHEAIMNIVLTGEMLAKEGQRIFRPLGLTNSQFNVLILLKHQSNHEGITQTELGARLLVNRSNVTGLVDRMEEAGWVRRAPAPGDRRINKVQLTKEGSHLLGKAEILYYSRIREVMGGLSKKDLGAMNGLLGRVREKLYD
ncbi:MAG: MarR family transcriptional regulator [Candidatus Omnitrophica bacterium]|nr:MarR family transcriptional regulator [Candidatus Omnitrophota bacterium]